MGFYFYFIVAVVVILFMAPPSSSPLSAELQKSSGPLTRKGARARPELYFGA